MKRRLKLVQVIGYDLDDNIVACIDTRVSIAGNWITPKTAKKAMRKQGAVSCSRVNIWEDDKPTVSTYRSKTPSKSPRQLRRIAERLRLQKQENFNV